MFTTLPRLAANGGKDKFDSSSDQKTVEVEENMMSVKVLNSQDKITPDEGVRQIDPR